MGEVCCGKRGEEAGKETQKARKTAPQCRERDSNPHGDTPSRF